MNIVDKLQSTFNSLGANNVELLKEVYSENIVFEDPAHQIIGLDSFMLYCHNLYKNVSKCKFEFIHVSKLDGVAFLEWNMYLIHPRLNKGNEIIVPGISKIIFDDKITSHRDYFDLGAMLYEKLPCIGGIIRKIKSNLG